MKVVNISGGMGNQLFQLALYNKLIKDGHKDVFIDIGFYQEQNSFFYFIYRIIRGIPKRKFLFENELQFIILNRNDLIKSVYHSRTYRQILNFLNYFFPLKFIFRFSKRVDVVNEKFFFNWQNNNKIIIFDGYWQDFDFIEKQEHFLNDLLRLKYKNEFTDVLNFKLVLHVRRGDQATILSKNIYNILDNNYYLESLKFLGKIGVIIDKITVCSDDINWCKRNMTDIQELYNVDFSNSSTMLEDFLLMYNAQYLISSNSTFSFWAGILGNSDIVITPKKWYNRIPYNFINNYSKIKEI
jgi:hypothetical protein